MKLLNIRIASLSILLFSAFNLQAQIITTVAGNGISGYGGDGGAATSARISGPNGVALDATANIFIADFNNNRIRKVNTSGVISTVAGSGTSGYSGDSGSATSAKLYSPSYVAVDTSGNLFITDYQNSVIRKVSTRGVITTVAGNGTIGYSGDGGSAISAQLLPSTGVAVDASGNLFFSSVADSRIRKVSASGVITTVAGNGTQGYSGDGGSAISAQLYYPSGLAVDSSGNLFIADKLNNRIRKVSTSGIITTVVGNGMQGYSGDGGSATAAKLYKPFDVAVDASGNLFIADFGNNRIRKVSTGGVITTVAGNGTGGYSGDGGSADSAELWGPVGVAVDAAGNIYISDYLNNRIRKVSVGPLSVTLASFTVTANNKTITTNWHTSTELNTSHFIIQHSTNGTSFTDIATVKAVGSGANGYSFTDKNTTNGINYYRLKSIDKDGSSSFSKIVSVQFTVNSNQLAVFPNPSKDKVTVKGNHIMSIQVIDNLGRIMKSQTLKGATNPTLTVNALPVGVYRLRVQTTDGKVSSANFVKE